MHSTDFYDEFASVYHLIAAGWDGAVRRQGEVLHEVLAERTGDGGLSILDSSCGIGTQSIGLAMKGHDVVGVDPSKRSIARARREAERFVEVERRPKFRVGDMRRLDAVDGSFDAVVTLDNSVAHLPDDADLEQMVAASKSVLKPWGILVVGVRDYDAVQQKRPTGTRPRRIDDEHGERVYVQTWEWSQDGRYYDMELFIISRKENGWRTKAATVRMRAWGRGKLQAAFENQGFDRIEWLEPENTGFHQPMLVASLGCPGNVQYEGAV
jgi:SAM-dependent methyltransferase